MKNLVLTLTAFATLTIASQAQAFFIEPFVSYMPSGQLKTVTTDDLTGASYGLRLGDSTLGFLYGLEYNMGKFVQTTAVATTVDQDSTNIGIVVGYEFPILLRAWLTYNVSTKLKNAVDEVDGSGYKLGVGYTGLPFLVIGAELLSYSFDAKGITPKQEISGASFFVSIPLP